MKSIQISEFKAHALRILDTISKTKESVVITRRGKPLAEVIPYMSNADSAKPGRLASALIFEKDIVSPLDEGIWESCR
jgi:prevent-host-death family protein